MRPKLGVIGRIQIQERTGFRQYPALKRAAVDRGDAIPAGGCGTVGVEFDGGEMSAGVLVISSSAVPSPTQGSMAAYGAEDISKARMFWASSTGKG